MQTNIQHAPSEVLAAKSASEVNLIRARDGMVGWP